MIGLYFQTLPHASAADVQRAATGMQWVKISDPALIPVARTYCRSVYLRCYLPDDGDCQDGAAWAEQITASIGHVWPAACVFRNEISADAGQVAQYQAWRATLRANGYRGLCVYGSFAVGTPDFGAWPAIVKAFGDAPPDALDLHEYYDLSVSGSSPWWALRHVELVRRGLIPATWRLFIGETGSDAIGAEDAQKRRGWNDRDKLTPAQMSAQLRAFVASCAPSVVCAFVFGDGGNDPNWNSYRTFGTPVEAAIRATAQGNGVPGPQDAPGGPEPVSTGTDQGGKPVLKLVDLSRVNNVTDWAALAAYCDGVIIQTSYGGVSAEGRGAEYWAAAKAHGLRRMAYHYLYPQYNTPELEAANFLRNVTIEPGDGWAVDVEEDCLNPAAYSASFMQLVEQRTGAPRNWYSYWSYIQGYQITAAELGNPHLWLADYTATEPAPPSGWASIAIWQHTSSAAIPGVAGLVDEDLVFMTEEQFAALCKPQPQEGANVATIDPITQLAMTRAKAANPAIVPNVDSANFKAYREIIRVWDANGRPNELDPGPWLRNEAATATDAWVLLYSGAILHSTNTSGQWVTYVAADSERQAIYSATGWGKAA